MYVQSKAYAIIDVPLIPDYITHTVYKENHFLFHFNVQHVWSNGLFSSACLL